MLKAVAEPWVKVDHLVVKMPYFVWSLAEDNTGAFVNEDEKTTLTGKATRQ
jgi:hypothetical protein